MCKNENYIKCFKDTFFNVKRVQSGLTIKEVAEYVGTRPSTTAAYLTGALMPKDAVIDKFCELFDVDTVRGQSEFRLAHDKWDAEFNKTVKVRVPTKQPAEPAEEPKVPNSPVVEGFMGFLDGVTSALDDGKAVPVECASKDKAVADSKDYSAVLDLIYGQVNLETYRAVEKIIKGE